MVKKKSFQIGNMLTEGLEETISAAHHYKGELRLEAISLKRIELDPDNPRDMLITIEDILNGIIPGEPQFQQKQAEKEKLESIAHSIHQQGIINPILVYKQGDKYRLIAGERRTLASLLAGKEDIQAKIYDKKPSPLKLSLLQWMENMEREDLSLWERIRNLEKIVAAHQEEQGKGIADFSLSSLGTLIGCSRTQAMHYKAVLLANDSLKSLIAENQISNLEKAALLANIDNESIQKEAIKACLAAGTLDELKKIANQEKIRPKKVTLADKHEGRGRIATRVNLGTTTNLAAIKLLMESLVQHPDLQYLSSLLDNVQWSNYHSVTLVFKKLLQSLEKIT